ncbi:type II secretion system protein N [Pseudomonas izuensis]|uniref:type II secretion system protein N n=1 Tax=Pseudomonas izuensis TaxID=2684212 RepID=UPI0031B5CE12
MSFPAPVATPTPRAPLDTSAILTVFGLSAETPLLPSAEPLTLQASFVRDSGLSRALLADGQGSRIYQVGDQLPGGSVLRRVEANQAVLWNKGREEVLTLQTSTAGFLRRFDPQAETQTRVISARYLRPHSGPSE